MLLWSTFKVLPDSLFQSFIHSCKAAIRLIASHIKKFAFLFARRADFRWLCFDNCIAAIATLPRIFRNRCFIVCHCRIFSLFIFHKSSAKTVNPVRKSSTYPMIGSHMALNHVFAEKERTIILLQAR